MTRTGEHRSRLQWTASVLLVILMVLGTVGIFGALFGDLKVAAAAGTYYVRVSWNTTNTKDDSDNYYTIYYKKQDGTTGEATYSNTTKNSGNQSHDHAIDGVPYAIKMQVWGRSTAAAAWYVTSVTVSPNSNYTSDATTLWSGEFGGKKARFLGEGSASTLTFPNSYTSFSNNGVSDEKKTTSSYYSGSYTPAASSITAITGGSTELYVPTDGTSTNYTNAFSAGTVKDQFVVNW